VTLTVYEIMATFRKIPVGILLDPDFSLTDNSDSFNYQIGITTSRKKENNAKENVPNSISTKNAVSQYV
jgi:hypothetical protein